jgi:hypothetical protein
MEHKTEKKQYNSPRVTVYGRVEEITRQGGGTATDVPEGSPVIDGDPNTVIGPVS